MEFNNADELKVKQSQHPIECQLSINTYILSINIH